MTQIAGINLNKPSIKALIGSAAIAMAVSGCYEEKIVNPPEPKLPKALKVEERRPLSVGKLDSTLTKGLKDTSYLNMRGGLVQTYTDSSIEVLKNNILAQNLTPKYTFPVDSAYKPYVSGWGLFGSPRGNRPHLGVDIYTTRAGKKPKNPVAILSPVDGIIVSRKQANSKNKIVANILKIMGVDGRIYTFDHLAKASDYPNFREIPLKTIGTKVNKRDTLGIMGNTGETAVWHLHFAVEDLDAKKQQLKNPVWQELYRRFKDFAKPEGQVNPLDTTKSGGIAKILNQYKIEKGPLLPLIKQL